MMADEIGTGAAMALVVIVAVVVWGLAVVGGYTVANWMGWI